MPLKYIAINCPVGCKCGAKEDIEAQLRRSGFTDTPVIHQSQLRDGSIKP